MRFRVSILSVVLLSLFTVGAFAATAVDDSYSVHAGTTLTVPPPGVLLNDSGGFSILSNSQPSHSTGSITVNMNGSFSYTPVAGYVGPDSFTYTLDTSPPATVSINVTNTAPVANNDIYPTNKGQSLGVSAPGVLSNDSDPDGDPITASQFSSTSNGTLSLSSNGSFSYTPNGGFRGTDSFSYAANDGIVSSGLATVSIIVDTAPVGNADFYNTGGGGGTLPISAPGVLANDTDADVGDVLTAALISGPSNASAFTLNPNGSFSYTANATFAGTDTFTYKANDGLRQSSPTTVTINVAGPPPTSTFSASPTSINSGQSSTLSWTTSNATSVTIDNGIGTVASNGSTTVSPTSTTTYTLSATNGGGTTTRSVTVNVCATITLSPASLPGGSVGVAYSQVISASGGAGPYGFSLTSGALPNGLMVFPSGVLSGTPTAQGVFNFTVGATDANGCTGSKAYSLTITGSGPTITSFTASPSTINSGQTSTLAWTTSNATSVSIDHGVGTVANDGSTVVSPNSTTTYTLTATNAGGTTTRSVTVTVNSGGTAINSFTANPSVIRSGASSLLSWSTSGASTIIITPDVGSVSASGAQTVSPRTTTTYTITASGAGSETAQTTVTVLDLSLSPSSATIERLGSASFNVSLSQAQSADVQVTLTSSDPAIAAFPSQIVIPAGGLSRSLTVQGLVAGTTRLSASLPPALGGSVAVSTLNVTPIPARVVVTAFPSVLTEIAADGTAASTTFTLSNIGDVAATVSIAATTTGVNFYNVSPATFSLPGNSSEVITVTALPQPLPGSFFGSAIVTADGAQLTSLPVRLLAFAPQGLGIPNVVAVTTRIDLTGPVGTNPSGVLTYRNNGSTRATGVVAPDVAWIIPAPGIVTIEPGQTADVPFQIDRSKQPASSSSGSIQGNTTLVYQAGTTGEKLLDGIPALSLVVPITDTRQPQTSAGGVPPLGPGEVALIVPGIGHVTGSGGKEFISDVSILNTQSFFSIPDVKLYYSSGATTVSAPQSVAPNQALQLADAVNTYFKQGTASQGTLHIRSVDTSKLSVNANVFNKANSKGTYGTAIPIFRSNRAVGPGETGVLTGLRKDATIHTNLYLQEMAGSATTARIDFYDANGGRVGGLDSSLGAFGFNAVGAVIPNAAVMATVTNSSGSGRLQAYATPVDDASGDTWAVADWNRQNALTGNEAMMIPVAGFVPGANGANFRTDIAVTNIGTGSGSITLTYYPSGVGAVTKSIPLSPNQTSVTSDVTETLFSIPGASVGWISLAPQAGARFAVTSRTYTASTDPGTFGTGVPTLALNKALAKGQFQTFGGIEDTNIKTQNNRSGNTFRTNIALVETRGVAVSVRVSVSFANGTSLAGGSNGMKNFDLTPHQFLQLNGVVRQILGASRDTNYGDLHNVQVKIEVIDGGGAVIPFVTSTDNGTNDTVLRTE
ncbi:MAG TPA: Ig-like domain-containing protein [Thermoanaerobaculia bacterium]|nr:Ig-like domain-containing protein [Thermoanaerobaculia bacterium]